MNTSTSLYIIGNGFDRHHSIPSDYRDFGSYLAAVDRDTYREVEAISRTHHSTAPGSKRKAAHWTSK